jgi:hypothetical protein
VVRRKKYLEEQSIDYRYRYRTITAERINFENIMQLDNKRGTKEVNLPPLLEVRNAQLHFGFNIINSLAILTAPFCGIIIVAHLPTGGIGKHILTAAFRSLQPTSEEEGRGEEAGPCRRKVGPCRTRGRDCFFLLDSFWKNNNKNITN